jgi:ppGpp synthetase/RelA/SpoT-type nucleotidyltranferase
MRKLIASKGIDVAHTTSRAKTLNSFLEKLSRKSYGNPFDEITDLAGVRVVCLYRSDIPRLEAIVNSEFAVIEKVDKLRNMSENEFGYGAVHYVVKLGSEARGARYDDLKNLVCEIQLRTVLQDAWAIIDHHLVYKQESDVPSVLLRKLNGLSGLFETADDSFDTIRKDREHYLQEVTKSAASNETFLKNELNKDTLLSFLKWKFPDLPPYAADTHSQLASSLRAIRLVNAGAIKTLGDLNAEYDKAGEKANKLYGLLSRKYARIRNGSMRLKYSLGLLHDEVLNAPGSSKEWVRVVREYKIKEASNNKLQRKAKDHH